MKGYRNGFPCKIGGKAAGINASNIKLEFIHHTSQENRCEWGAILLKCLLQRGGNIRTLSDDIKEVAHYLLAMSVFCYGKLQ